MATFIRRAGRFMSSLIQGANTETFTAIEAFPDETVTGEDAENVNRTVKIMEDMGRIEAQRDEQGNVTAVRLTSDGAAFREFHFGGE